MPSLNEEFNTELNSELQQGLETLSLSQTVTFTQYVRVVLPLDGFVFWVSADLLSASALLNANALNTFALNQVASVAIPAPTLTVAGSLHHSTEFTQREEGSYAVNRILFTAQQEVQDFNAVSPSMIYLAEIDGVQYAFARRESFYQQAGLYHYQGDAVYAPMTSQIISKIEDLNTLNIVCSNSLPIWLSLNKFMPMYPSMLAPANLEPPYATVHIEPNLTEAIQAAPNFDSKLSHYQLVTDTVKLTIFGLRNFSALDFQDYVFQYSLDTDLFGVMNLPVIRDVKRNQTELNMLAMGKTMELKINYYQTRMQDVARQLILSAIPTFYFEE